MIEWGTMIYSGIMLGMIGLGVFLITLLIRKLLVKK